MCENSKIYNFSHIYRDTWYIIFKLWNLKYILYMLAQWHGKDGNIFMAFCGLWNFE